MFEKKYVTSKSFNSKARIKKLSGKSSIPMSKQTCSSLCLSKKGEECEAFRVNDDNECELINRPHKLKEVNHMCKDGANPGIPVWTSKNVKQPGMSDLLCS